MNWELVAQVAIVTLVVLFAVIVLFSVVDVLMKNRHERRMELHRLERECSREGGA